jgi:predicted Rossmann fold nucleotide-binding protein DprA/Smf involved in DNA uptake
MVVDVSEITNKKELLKQESLFGDNLSDQEKEIVKILKLEPLTIDELARKVNMGVGELSVKVSLMTMNGQLNESNGKIYLAA